MNLEKTVLGKRNSQRTHAIHFHLCKRSGEGKSRGRTEISGCPGQRDGEWGMTAYTYRTSSKGENIIDSGYGKCLHNFTNIAKPLN